MTTTTIEQFREQCAKVCEETELHFAINTWMNSSKLEMTVLTANTLAEHIRALPLPVMPEQAEPVKPICTLMLGGLESDSSGDYEFGDYDIEFNHKNVAELQEELVSSENSVEVPLFAQDPSGLLARIAELEAENQKLKEVVERADILAQAGLCQMSHTGTREYCQDIRTLAKETLGK